MAKNVIKNTFFKKSLVRNFFLVLLFVALFLSSAYGYRCLFEKVCEHEELDRIVRHDMDITTPKGKVLAEVVSTQLSRAQGLSGRSMMKEGEGMLFVFDHPGKYGFWMKGMNFPLDIIWINENGIVVWVERNVRPDSYPTAYMNQGADARFVLEVNAGMSEKLGLYLGSKVVFSE